MSAKRECDALRPVTRLPQAQLTRLRLKDVLSMGKFSRSTLYARIAAKQFPPPRKDGRMSWWSFGEVVDALQLTDCERHDA